MFRLCLGLVLVGTFMGGQIEGQVWQNLVKNPSFEQNRQIPKDLGEINLAVEWSSPSRGTPDYFHRKSPTPMARLPKGKMGLANPRSGSAYAGFYAYTNRYTKREFREYLQVNLKQPLIQGRLYCIKTWVYLAESSNRSIGALCATLTRSGATWTHEGPAQEQISQFTYLLRPERKALSERMWMEISGQYRAQGGETNLIIGNFLNDKATKVGGAIEFEDFRNPNVDFAYYFIDDVCVTDLSSNFDCNCGDFDESGPKRERIVVDFRLSPKDYDLDEAVVLHRLSFEKNKAIFTGESEEDLRDLLAMLQRYPDRRLEIAGHTDDRLRPQESQELSKRRAKAVYDYLVASGIALERLTYRGYGQSRPVAPNSDKEGRARNERIEIKFTK